MELFGSSKKDKGTVLDAQIAHLIDELDYMPADSNDYGTIAINLEKLYKARNEMLKGNSKKDFTWAIPLVTALISAYVTTKQVKMILGYEKDAALTSKAVMFMLKPFRNGI